MKIISKDHIEERKSPPEYNLKSEKKIKVNIVTSDSPPTSTEVDGLKATARPTPSNQENRSGHNARKDRIDKDRERRKIEKHKRRAKLDAKAKSKGIKIYKTAEIDASSSKDKDKTKNKNTDDVFIFESGEARSYLGSRFEQVTSLIRFNITFKLTLGYALRYVMVLVFIITAAYASFAYYLFYESDNKMASQVSYIEQMLNDGYGLENSLLTSYLDQNDLRVYIYDGNTKDLLASSSIDQALLYDAIDFPGTFNLTNFPKMQNLYRDLPYEYQNQNAILVLEKNMIPATEILEMTLPIVIVMSIVLLLTSIRAASKMANKQLRPIHTMTKQVQNMSISNRLNISGTKDELKDLAQTFNDMLDDIQKSYEREQQFVSDASHELRTPIAVIKGYANMLNRWGKEDPEILNESIEAIIGETENMHSLVESLLFIARNDKGTLKMDMERFDLTHLMNEIVKETRLIDTQHEFTTEITKTCPQYGSADKLKQAIRILIDNSIKYTPDKGHILINLEKNGAYNVITIQDNGIGISKEDLPHIFDRFYRADKSRTKMKDNQHGGSGLGLSIAKIIIEQHGGAIDVDSDLNIGTTFTLKLQCLKEEAPSKAKADLA